MTIKSQIGVVSAIVAIAATGVISCKSTSRQSRARDLSAESRDSGADSLSSVIISFYTLSYDLYDHATLGTPVAGEISVLTDSMALSDSGGAGTNNDTARRIDEIERQLNGLSANTANNSDDLDKMRDEFKKSLAKLRADIDSAKDLAISADAAAKLAADSMRRLNAKSTSSNGAKKSGTELSDDKLDALEKARTRSVNERKQNALSLIDILHKYNRSRYTSGSAPYKRFDHYFDTAIFMEFTYNDLACDAQIGEATHYSCKKIEPGQFGSVLCFDRKYGATLYLDGDCVVDDSNAGNIKKYCRMN